jgi:hypothetical protein
VRRVGVDWAYNEIEGPGGMEWSGKEVYHRVRKMGKAFA